MQIKPGTRLRSAVCDVEAIVVKAPNEDVDLRCGGEPMLDATTPRPASPGSDASSGQVGAQVGKRYTDPDGRIEILCTKSGPSSLSIGDTALAIKEAKPLPASD